MSFSIDEIPREPVKINDIILNKNRSVLVKENVKINVIAEGGIKPLYSFIVRKDNNEIEKVDFGECNWVNLFQKKQEDLKLKLELRTSTQIKCLMPMK
jgi:hypothetical protein